MKLTTRRRALVGAVASATLLAGGLAVAPNVLAADNGLTISPSGVQNNETRELTFTGRDTAFQYGATATFVQPGKPATFTVTIGGDTVPMGVTHDGSASVNFSDLSDKNDNVESGVGRDGPVDSGTYQVTTVGNKGNQAEEAVFPGGGTDNCVCFTVLPASPLTVSSAAPTSLRPGRDANVSVLGTGFERGSVIEVLFPDGTVDTKITTNAPPLDESASPPKPIYEGITTNTELKRRWTVLATPAGSRNVRVTNLDGTTKTCVGCFTVAGPALTGVAPAAAFNTPGQSLTTLTFTGSNITNGKPYLEFVGTPGGTTRSALTIPGNVTSYNAAAPTTMTATFDLQNAAPGDNAYQPVVRNTTTGIVNACDSCRFTVTQSTARMPTITSADSDARTAGAQKDIKQGETKQFLISGTNFSKGAAVIVSGTGVTVTAVDFISPEQLRATIAATSAATAGARDLSVKLTDGKTSNTCTGCLNVQSTATPTATSTATSSATPTATTSPSTSGSACPAPRITFASGENDIVVGERSHVTISGAPNQMVEIRGYSRPSKTEVRIHQPQPLDANGNRPDSFVPKTNSRIFAVALGSNGRECARSSGYVIKVHAAMTIEVHHVRGAHKMTVSGTFNPGPTSKNGRLNSGREITLYQQLDGQKGQPLKTITLSSTSYSFTYTFKSTKSLRLFVRTETNYINYSAETTKVRTSTY